MQRSCGILMQEITACFPRCFFLFILISVLQSFLCFPEFAALPTAAVKDQMRGIQRKVMLLQDKMCIRDRSYADDIWVLEDGKVKQEAGKGDGQA